METLRKWAFFVEVVRGAVKPGPSWREHRDRTPSIRGTQRTAGRGRSAQRRPTTGGHRTEIR